MKNSHSLSLQLTKERKRMKKKSKKIDKIQNDNTNILLFTKFDYNYTFKAPISQELNL
jgi:hypothetical protein